MTARPASMWSHSLSGCAAQPERLCHQRRGSILVAVLISTVLAAMVALMAAREEWAEGGRGYTKWINARDVFRAKKNAYYAAHKEAKP